MNSMLRIAPILALFCSGTALAQPYGYLSPATQPTQQVNPASPESAVPDSVDPRLMERMFAPESHAESELLVQEIVPENLQGRVERGVLPDFMTRNYNQNTSAGNQGRSPGTRTAASGGRRAAARSGRRSGSGSQRTSQASNDEVRNFTANAFQFDSNGDGQLAANELSNLFLVLTSSLDAEDTVAPRNGPTGLGPDIINQTLIQRQSVREAESVFLNLMMDFDRNADSLLNQGEVGTMATCLQQNNLSLIDASQQNATQAAPVFSNSLAPPAGQTFQNAAPPN